jgi:hypothetical protein
MCHSINTVGVVCLGTSDAPASSVRGTSAATFQHHTTQPAQTTQQHRSPFRKPGARLPGTSTLLYRMCRCIFPIQRSTTSPRPQRIAGAAVVGGTEYLCLVFSPGRRRIRDKGEKSVECVVLTKRKICRIGGYAIIRSNHAVLYFVSSAIR